MFTKGQRLVHKSLPGEYEFREVDDRGIMTVLEVDEEQPKKKWNAKYFRYEDSKFDWTEIH